MSSQSSIPSQPVDILRTVDVDLSTKCNLRCRFCHLSEYVPAENGQFDITSFEALLMQVPSSVQSLILFSKFEALTCRDFLPIFKSIKKRGFKETYFSTNGILLSEDIISELVGHLTFLTISITGFDKEEYKKNMSSDKLDIVTEKIRLINALKSSRGTDLPRLRISVVGMQDTVDSFMKAVDFAHDFDITEGVQVSYFNAHRKDMDSLMPAYNLTRFMSYFRNAKEYADSMGVKFELQGGVPEDIEKEILPNTNHKYCSLPFSRLSIQPTGDVYPCPVAYTPVGNLKEASLMDIWNGERLRAFRGGVNTEIDQNPDCRDCSYCRVKSPVQLAGNRLSDKKVLWAGMKRK